MLAGYRFSRSAISTTFQHELVSEPLTVDLSDDVTTLTLSASAPIFIENGLPVQTVILSARTNQVILVTPPSGGILNARVSATIVSAQGQKEEDMGTWEVSGT